MKKHKSPNYLGFLGFLSTRGAITAIFAGFMAFLGVVATAQAQDVLEAKQDGVKIVKEASKDAPEVATLKKGEEVKSLGRKGMFWQVESKSGAQGYVSFLAVSRKAAGGSALSEAMGKAALESRDMDDVKGTRARSAVMGIRGLDENSETSSAGNVSPNLRLVYGMEDMKVSKEKLDQLADLVRQEVSARAQERERRSP